MNVNEFMNIVEWIDDVNKLIDLHRLKEVDVKTMK